MWVNIGAQVLTDLKIKAAKPQPKPYRLTDGQGLHLLVHPNGGKYWQLRYRFLGKENTESFGVYPDVTLAEAREKRETVRQLLRKDKNPSFEKKLEKQRRINSQQNSFEYVARGWYEVWKSGKDNQTAEYKWRRIEDDLLPHLGPRPIDQLTRREVIDAVKKISARGVTDTARRALQVIKSIFAYAVTHEYRESSPIADLRPSDIIGAYEKKHYARIDGSRLPELLIKIDEYEGAITRYALQLLCLTFVRTGTLRKATWGEIDFVNKQWNIPAQNMKKVRGSRQRHIVPLANQTLKLLTELNSLTGPEGHLFPGLSGGAISENTILKALSRMGFKGEMTGHGFRGLASTLLHEHGFEHLHIESQLAHVERNDSSAPYNQAEYLEQRREMMAWWADYLESRRTMG